MHQTGCALNWGNRVGCIWQVLLQIVFLFILRFDINLHTPSLHNQQTEPPLPWSSDTTLMYEALLSITSMYVRVAVHAYKAIAGIWTFE